MPGSLTTNEAAALLGVSSRHVGWLIRRGQITGHRSGKSWVIDEDSVRTKLAARSEWISYADAAEIVGCHITTIGHALGRGEIEQRTVHRTLPSLRRESVERFAVEWRARQQAAAERRAQKKARRFLPPDDGHVWLDATTTALVLGLSTSRVGQLAEQERLPFTVSAGRRWFRRDHVEQIAFARAHRVPATRGRARPQDDSEKGVQTVDTLDLDPHAEADLTFGGCGDPDCPTGSAGRPRPDLRSIL